MLPLGQPLLLGTLVIATATTAVVLHQDAAVAQDAINYFNNGNGKLRSKDYQGAIADYNKAIAINPQYGRCLYRSWRCQESFKRLSRSNC